MKQPLTVRFLRNALFAVLATGVVAGFSRSAQADMTFVTPVGSTAGGQSVDATATFMFSANQVTITLTNLEANPTADVQNVNGVSFSLSTLQTSGTLSSSMAIQRTITSTAPGGFTDTGMLTTNWHLSTPPSPFAFDLTTIGNAHATETLIGNPDANNAYSAANGSIVLSNHNSFLAGTATFVLSITGVTSSSQISSMQFQFGTAAPTTDTVVVGVKAVPEPASFALLAIGASGAFLGRLRRSRKQPAADRLDG